MLAWFSKLMSRSSGNNGKLSDGNISVYSNISRLAKQLKTRVEESKDGWNYREVLSSIREIRVLASLLSSQTEAEEQQGDLTVWKHRAKMTENGTSCDCELLYIQFCGIEPSTLTVLKLNAQCGGPRIVFWVQASPFWPENVQYCGREDIAWDFEMQKLDSWLAEPPLGTVRSFFINIFSKEYEGLDKKIKKLGLSELEKSKMAQHIDELRRKCDDLEKKKEHHEARAKDFESRYTEALEESTRNSNNLKEKLENVRQRLLEYQAQASSLARGAGGEIPIPNELDLPSIVEIPTICMRLVNDTKTVFLISRDRKYRIMLCDAMRKLTHGMYALMEGLYKQKLERMLEVFGNVEDIANISRATDDMFFLYCKKHWRKMFLGLKDELGDKSDANKQKSRRDQEAKDTLQKLFEEYCGSTYGPNSNSEVLKKVFQDLWKLTIVMFLQKPTMGFVGPSNVESVPFNEEQHQLLESSVPKGAGVRVIFPRIVTAPASECRLDAYSKLIESQSGKDAGECNKWVTFRKALVDPLPSDKS